MLNPRDNQPLHPYYQKLIDSFRMSYPRVSEKKAFPLVFPRGIEGHWMKPEDLKPVEELNQKSAT